MPKPEKKTEFWNNFIRAVEAEPREAAPIRGASGFAHPVAGVGVDDSRQRVVLISGETDARTAALAANDIQSAMPNAKVIMARPVAVNLGAVARLMSGIFGKTRIGKADFDWLNQQSLEEKQARNAEVINRLSDSFKLKSFVPASLNLITAFKEAIHQCSLIEIEFSNDQEIQASSVIFNLEKLVTLDPAEEDRNMGVCPIPIYLISNEEFERINSRRDVDSARDILQRENIIQYFFPPPDQLALALFEKEPVNPSVMLERLTEIPSLGHPFGTSEILEPSIGLPHIIDALHERGLLVEGEVSVELSQKGKEIRSKIRFTPREGLLSKLSRIFSMKFDLSLKDFFH